MTSGGRNEVVIRAGARLHLGLVKTGGGPEYAAAGISLAEPYITVSARRAGRLCVYGPDRARTARVVKAVCASIGVRPQFSVRIEKSLPAHSGFGSGTRADLAVGKAVMRLAGARGTIFTLTRLLGRGGRSMMGTALFARGGFVADTEGGLSRARFPSAWRIVLITPRNQRTEPAAPVFGSHENRWVNGVRPLTAKARQRVAESLEQDLTPAVAGEDYETFAGAVELLQRQAEKQFRRVQGGSAATEAGRRIMGYLRRAGVRACGQTSWGPTLFAITPCPGDAQTLAARLADHPAVRSAMVTRAVNTGFRAAYL